MKPNETTAIAGRNCWQIQEIPQEPATQSPGILGLLGNCSSMTVAAPTPTLVGGGAWAAFYHPVDNGMVQSAPQPGNAQTQTPPDTSRMSAGGRRELPCAPVAAAAAAKVQRRRRTGPDIGTAAITRAGGGRGSPPPLSPPPSLPPPRANRCLAGSTAHDGRPTVEPPLSDAKA